MRLSEIKKLEEYKKEHGGGLPLLEIGKIKCSYKVCLHYPKCFIGGNLENNWYPKLLRKWTTTEDRGKILELYCQSAEDGRIEEFDRLERLQKTIDKMEDKNGGTHLPNRQESGISSETRENVHTFKEKVQATDRVRTSDKPDSERLPNNNGNVNSDSGMGKEETPPKTNDPKGGRALNPWNWLDPDFSFPTKIGTGVEYHGNRDKYKRTICIDFDGVIHDHVYAKDFSTQLDFYDKIPGAPEALKELYHHGWYIIIFTVRQIDEKLINWLNKNSIWYHDVNGIRPPHCRKWAHNPDNTGIKPIADVYLDDKDLFWINLAHRNNQSKWNWKLVMDILKIEFPEMWGI